MKPKHQRFWISSSQIFHDAGPDAPRCAELSHFLKQVVMGIKEKRKAFTKNINIQSFFKCCFYIGFTIAECKSNFLYGCAASFADVVTGDRNGIPLGQLCTAPF